MILADKLKNEIAIWEKKSYAEFLAIEYPYVYERGEEGDPDWCNVELVILEKNDEYVHVGIAVSDKSSWSSFFPKSTSVIAYSGKGTKA